MRQSTWIQFMTVSILLFRLVGSKEEYLPFDSDGNFYVNRERDHESQEPNYVNTLDLERMGTIPADSEEEADVHLWVQEKKKEVRCLLLSIQRASTNEVSTGSERETEDENATCRTSSDELFLALNSSWSEEDRGRWIEHTQAELHCHLLALQEVNDQAISNYCPRVWDRVLCWPPTPANTKVSIPCSLYNNATRFCQEDGHWFNSSHKRGIGFTNYSDCLDDDDFPYEKWLPWIKTISITGYSISLVTLLISFAILISLRRLRCPRNVLHLHLFASFIFRAIVILLKASFQRHFDEASIGYFHEGDDIVENPNKSGTWWCKLAIVMWQYFIVANYSWILMEGLYLHNLIFLALFSDSSAITLYIILGWGIPSVFVAAWAILRAMMDDSACWTIHNSSWIFWGCIRLPVALSNLINFFFFINVTRVLFSKFRSSINPESMKYRKLAKSTLVLVPLFGVPYFLMWGLSTSSNPLVELVWLFLDQIFASFQGFFVAVLYCLMNGEVRQELVKKYYKLRGESVPNASHSTVISHTKSYFSQCYRRCRGTSSSKANSLDAGRGQQSIPSPYSIRESSRHASPRENSNGTPFHSQSSNSPVFKEYIHCNTQVPKSVEVIELESRGPVLARNTSGEPCEEEEQISLLTPVQAEQDLYLRAKDSELNKTTPCLVLLGETSQGYSSANHVKHLSNGGKPKSQSSSKTKTVQKDTYVNLNHGCQTVEASIHDENTSRTVSRI